MKSSHWLTAILYTNVKSRHIDFNGQHQLAILANPVDLNILIRITNKR